MPRKLPAVTPQKLIDRILAAEIASNDEIVPCSARDIKRLEKAAGGKLPREYVEIMRTIGRRAGSMFADAAFYFPEILGATKNARAMLRDLVEFPPDAFVFYNSLGESILFLRLEDGDNPPIYRWHEGEETKVRRLKLNLWGVIEDELQSCEP